jgi:hypothetical protein
MRRRPPLHHIGRDPDCAYPRWDRSGLTAMALGAGSPDRATAAY